jgi:TonB-dependent SusC/RagA subfamily outer membrane receptor
MKLILSKGSILLVLMFFSFQLKAQERTIQGIVTTFDSIAVHGATIKVNSTKQIVLSDSAGKYSVGCDYNDKLKISASGFYNQNVKLEKNISYVAVNLKLKAGDKNKELALGLTSVSDHDKLNALAALDADDIDFSQYRTMQEAIAGRIPGVQISGSEIIIRGSSNLDGPLYALIVVDGVPAGPGALDRMNPATVKSINVIKDGSSAIYGSKGANGVVVIETKTGRDN